MIRLLTLALAFGLASAADAQTHHPANPQAETAQTATYAPDLEPVTAVNEPRMLRQGAKCCECCDHGSEAGAMCEMHGDGAACCCEGHGAAHGENAEGCCAHKAEGHAHGAAADAHAGHSCCGRDGHGANAHAGHAAAAASAHASHTSGDDAHLTSDAVGHLHSALTAYFTIGDALANDSVEGVNARIREFDTAFEALASSEVHGDEHFWHTRTSQVQTVRQRAASIASLNEIEAIRVEYGYLSDALEGIVRGTGVHGMDNVYVMICGMYREAPQNGVWLQIGETPRNPYFGSSMLRCTRSQTAL